MIRTPIQDVIHVGEGGGQLKEEAGAGGKYDLNLVSRNEKAKVCLTPLYENAL